MKDIIPITGLPRSGSTLLMNILNQNPKFYTSQDSCLSVLIANTKNIIENFTYEQQIPYEDFQKSVLNFCFSGTRGWVDNLKENDQFFLDKSRGWIHNIDYLYKVFPNLKTICIIRDLRGLINSFEKIHNSSLTINRKDFDYDINENLLKQRIDYIFNLWFLKDGLLSIKELIDLPRPYKEKIFFVKYENLISDPEDTLNQIYDFLEIDRYHHDFDNIKQHPFNDNAFQPYGCHKIRSKVENLKQIYTELNEESINYILDEYIWYYEEFYPEVL